MTFRDEMRPYWDRFTWNLRHLRSEEYNPYVIDGEGDFTGANRTGFEDLFHSFKNLSVEANRIIWRRLVALWRRIT